MAVITLEPTVFLQSKNLVYHFVIVGAGGTGGYLIPNLMRQIGLHNNQPENKHNVEKQHTLAIIDKDDIEAKNLVRQNFTERDLGKNKAEVMATRYGRAFGVEAVAIPEYIESPAHFTDIIDKTLKIQRNKTIYQMNENASSYGQRERQINSLSTLFNDLAIVLIDCTDNNKTRLIMDITAKSIKQDRGTYFISSGNEERTGQVVFSRIKSNNLKLKACIDHMRISHLLSMNIFDTNVNTPTFFDIFPDTPIDKLPTELSCAESAISAPQNIGANMNAASIIFDFCNKLLTGQKISEFMVFFDIDSLGRTVLRFNEPDLTKALSFSDNNQGLNTFLGKEVENGIVAPTWEQEVERTQNDTKIKLAQLERELQGIQD